MRSIFVIREKHLHSFRPFAQYLYNYLNPKLNADELAKELEHVKIQDYRITKLKYEEKDSGGSDISGISSGSSDVTDIPPLFTVKEIVDIINEKYNRLISKEDVRIIEKYLDQIINDDELIADITSNQNQDTEIVFSDIFEPKMRNRFSSFLINNAPAKYNSLMGDDDFLRFINNSAFRMLRERALNSDKEII